MRSFRIAIYPGDGIGAEVIEQGVRVLKYIQSRMDGLEFCLEYLPWGSDYYFQHGQVVPENYLDLLHSFDAIFLGALGDPARIPDSVTLAPLVQVRQRFDQYACVRPAKLFPGIRSPLARPGDIDMLVIRENSEGEYTVCGGRLRRGEPDEVAIQSAVHTRRGIERILRFGFEQAVHRRRRLTMITKSNALSYGMSLWDEVLEQLKPEFPEVEAGRLHADAAAMDFVRRPDRFDVVVASNLFGDILTDLGGVIAGGVGLAPSANINPERKHPSMFEPVHGSAPDITGKGIANPIGTILSGAMMLEWLGVPEAAVLIRKGVEKTLACGAGTPDLGGGLTTAQMTDHIINHMGDHVRD